MKIRFSPEAVRHALTPLHNSFILDYMPHASGHAVQVYLYGLMQCSFPSTSELSISDALGLSDQAVLDAFRYWQEQGLVQISSDDPLTVSYLPIEGDTVPPVIVGQYSSLVKAINELTAPRQFDVRELRHVYDWIEVYGLDEGAVLELIAYCMDLKGRRVSVNYISSVAQGWSEEGIRTREQVLACIDSYNLKKHGATEILREWNKRRQPTRAEMALYEKWTGEWGFDHSAIMAALPQISSSGSPSFSYLDTLLDKLRGDHVTSSEDILRQAESNREEQAFARLLFERAGKAEPSTSTQRAQIRMYLDTYHMPRELLLFGAEQCQGAREPFGMMKRIWNDWREAGVDTLQKAEAYERERASKKYGKSAGKNRYPEHEYSTEDLDRMLIDLDGDNS